MEEFQGSYACYGGIDCRSLIPDEEEKMPSVAVVASVLEKIYPDCSRHLDRNWSFASTDEAQMVSAISIILRMYEEKLIVANVKDNASDWTEDNGRVFTITAQIANEMADLEEEQEDKKTTVETRKIRLERKIKTLQKSFYRIFPILCLNRNNLTYN